MRYFLPIVIVLIYLALSNDLIPTWVCDKADLSPFETNNKLILELK